MAGPECGDVLFVVGFVLLYTTRLVPVTLPKSTARSDPAFRTPHGSLGLSITAPRPLPANCNPPPLNEIDGLWPMQITNGTRATNNHAPVNKYILKTEEST